MTIRNRELSQFGSFIYIDNNTKDIGITTETTPYVGIGTTNPTSKFHVTGDALVTGIGTIATFNSANVTITNLTGTSGTITNGTITNLTGTAGTITTFNSTNGTITNLTGTAGTITTFNSTNGTINNLTGTSGTITTFNGTNGTITNLTGTSGTITTFNSTNGTITNLTGTSGTITNGTITNLTGTSGTITTFNSTNGTITNLTGTAGTITNGNITNLYVSGSAGIGTTNSTSKLHVIGDALVAGVATITNSSGTVNIGIGTTALLVQGTARVTDTLTIGSSSIILDGNNNQISIGTGFILNSNGISGFVGVITASSFVGELTGNAGTATSLASARDFSITGGFVTAPSVSFNGTQNISLAATIAPNSITLGTYTSGDYIQSITGITSEIIITGGTGESSTPTVGLSSNLVLPGNLVVNGISTFTGNTTFNQINITDVNAGVVSATAFYLGGSLLVDGALEVWLAASIDNQYSIYRELGNVGIGTSTNLYKLSVNGQIQSQASQGTAPFVVQSTTNVANLNADTVDGKHAPSGDIVGTSDSQTLTTKTLNLSNNTLTGTVAQFNTALSDDNFATLTGAETLTNKTLTSPSIGIITNTGGTSQNIPSGIGTLVSTSSTSVITTLMLVNGAVSNSQLINSTLSGVALGSSLFDHIPGSYISGNNYNGSSAQTWNVNAVSSNTADTIVARDSLKGFSAGHITVENITVSAGGTFFGDSAIVGSATTINSTGLNVTGIITASGGFNIGSTQVISSGRQLQNIASLDATTTATIESAVSNAPNTFTDLQISGISTFTNGPVFIGSGTSTGTASQRLQVSGGAYVSGNLGIGSTNPTSKLDVVGDVRVTGVITATTFSGNVNAGVGTITNLTGTAGTITNLTATSAIVGTAVTINSTGLNVTGIITASGGFNIGIQSGGLNVTTGVVTALNFIGAGNTFLYNSSTKTVSISISGGGSLSISTSITSVAQDIGFVGGAATSIIGIASVGSRFVYIPSTGSVGIGTSIPTSKLHVVGDVLVSGVVTCTDINSTSDAKLKTNVHTVQNALDVVDNLRGVSFDWKESGRSSYGVIAQELEEVLPELVGDGETKSVNYNGIIGVLIEAIKELKAEVRELKSAK